MAREDMTLRVVPAAMLRKCARVKRFRYEGGELTLPSGRTITLLGEEGYSFEGFGEEVSTKGVKYYLPQSLPKPLEPGFWETFTDETADIPTILREYGPLGDPLLDGAVWFVEGREAVRKDVVNAALDWFRDITRFFESAFDGNIDDIKRRMEKGTVFGWMEPYISAWDLGQEEDRELYLKALENDDTLVNEVIRFAEEVSKEWLSKVRLTYTPLHPGGGYCLCAVAPDWITGAFLSWYVDNFKDLRETKLCLCGCGLPARPGSLYFNEKHADRYRHRLHYRRKGK